MLARPVTAPVEYGRKVSKKQRCSGATRRFGLVRALEGVVECVCQPKPVPSTVGAGIVVHGGGGQMLSAA